MKRHNAMDFIAGVFVVAMVYVLARPQSKAVDLVKGFGAAMTAIVTHATDLAAT